MRSVKIIVVVKISFFCLKIMEHVAFLGRNTWALNFNVFFVAVVVLDLVQIYKYIFFVIEILKSQSLSAAITEKPFFFD